MGSRRTASHGSSERRSSASPVACQLGLAALMTVVPAAARCATVLKVVDEKRTTVVLRSPRINYTVFTLADSSFSVVRKRESPFSNRIQVQHRNRTSYRYNPDFERNGIRAVGRDGVHTVDWSTVERLSIGGMTRSRQKQQVLRASLHLKGGGRRRLLLVVPKESRACSEVYSRTSQGLHGHTALGAYGIALDKVKSITPVPLEEKLGGQAGWDHEHWPQNVLAIETATGLDIEMHSVSGTTSALLGAGVVGMDWRGIAKFALKGRAKKRRGTTKATVQLKTGEQRDIQVTAGSVLGGRTWLGTYGIPLAHVKSVTSTDERGGDEGLAGPSSGGLPNAHLEVTTKKGKRVELPNSNTLTGTVGGGKLTLGWAFIEELEVKKFRSRKGYQTVGRARIPYSRWSPVYDMAAEVLMTNGTTRRLEISGVRPLSLASGEGKGKCCVYLREVKTVRPIK